MRFQTLALCLREDGTNPAEVTRTSVDSVLGPLFGWALVGGLTRVLCGVGTNDPRVFVTVIVLLTGMALLASWMPAQRAARIDPLVATRHE